MALSSCWTMRSTRRPPERTPVLVAPVEMALEGQPYLLDEFFRAVSGGSDVGTSCQDNIRSLGIVFDVVQSFETGQVVQSSS